MHVNVTQELYRSYKERLGVLNDAILRRSVTVLLLLLLLQTFSVYAKFHYYFWEVRVKI